jgi:hypothetical protein
MKRKYGLTIEDWNILVEQQNGLCGICREKPPECVDHDHVTGMVRGLLCKWCNSNLGAFGDNIEGLERAIAYLKGAGT